MAKLLKLRRGTTSQHSSFTGAEGEVTVDTDKETLVVHDGSTAGGHPVAAEDMANVSSASIAGRLATDSIATTKIAAGALPTDVTVASANIVNGTIVNEDINSSAAIANSKLADSGVSAAAYGSSSAIPIITVNAKGIVTAASTTAIDSTTISNGSASVAVASNGPITSNANHDFSAGIDVTGNITVSGTVDGVDVATRDTLFGGLTSSSGVLTDGVTATTQSASDNSTKVATTAYVTTGIANAQAFPSGTKMLFQQTAAPTGWTKVTSGVDNKALRVVSGTAGSGGSNAFSNTLADRSITANAANATQGGNISVANATAGGNISVANASTSGTVNNHTLTTSQMPSHSHSYNHHTPNSGERDGDNVVVSFVNQNANGANTGNTGGGGGHNHGFTGSSHNHNASFSGSSHNHNATFSGSAHNHSISVTNLDMAVQYLDVIIAAKD